MGDRWGVQKQCKHWSAVSSGLAWVVGGAVALSFTGGKRQALCNCEWSADVCSSDNVALSGASVVLSSGIAAVGAQPWVTVSTSLYVSGVLYGNGSGLNNVDRKSVV